MIGYLIAAVSLLVNLFLYYLKYKSDKEWITISKGKLTVKKEMKPWDADLSVIRLIK